MASTIRIIREIADHAISGAPVTVMPDWNCDVVGVAVEWSGNYLFMPLDQARLVHAAIGEAVTEAEQTPPYSPPPVTQYPSDHTGEPSCSCTECIPF